MTTKFNPSAIQSARTYASCSKIPLYCYKQSSNVICHYCISHTKGDSIVLNCRLLDEFAEDAAIQICRNSDLGW